MSRATYLSLAAAGMRMPIGAHLVLHDHPDPEEILLDGRRLGAVVAETAERFRTPLALPLMDLALEKASLLSACGVPQAEIEGFRFTSAPNFPDDFPLTPRMRATCEAVTFVADRPGLAPVGMAIGPFSLMTKLVADPITPVYLAGSGTSAEEDAEVALVERLLGLGERVIHRYLEAQIDAGAGAVVICEPAANQVYFSPKQLAADAGHFERFVMDPMRRIAQFLEGRGVDLILHNCGELTDFMVRRFATLRAVMLSLGGSQTLWHDATLVPKDTVLYGNLPSKRFYDPQFTAAEVERRAQELVSRMSAAGHPFILGTECDVLSVPGREAEILSKVDAFMNSAAPV